MVVFITEEFGRIEISETEAYFTRDDLLAPLEKDVFDFKFSHPRTYQQFRYYPPTPWNRETRLEACMWNTIGRQQISK